MTMKMFYLMINKYAHNTLFVLDSIQFNNSFISQNDLLWDTTEM